MQIFEWRSDKLDNAGETLQLDRPGPLNDRGRTTPLRVDRVKYDDKLPWDARADGSGLSLSRIIENEYGNDFQNWKATPPSPGLSTPEPEGNFESWASGHLVDGFGGDPDRDGLSNLFEYAFNTDPNSPNSSGLLSVLNEGNSTSLRFAVPFPRGDIKVILQRSTNLETWTTVPTEINGEEMQASHPRDRVGFYRLSILKLP